MREVDIGTIASQLRVMSWPLYINDNGQVMCGTRHHLGYGVPYRLGQVGRCTVADFLDAIEAHIKSEHKNAG
jgi:hypothetical protein